MRDEDLPGEGDRVRPAPARPRKYQHDAALHAPRRSGVGRRTGSGRLTALCRFAASVDVTEATPVGSTLTTFHGRSLSHPVWSSMASGLAIRPNSFTSMT